MEADFWHERWRENRIGFHQEDGNAQLVRNLGQMSLASGARIFVPLCGKTRDIGWLLSQGHPVCGAELSELAVQQLFDDLGVEPVISDAGTLKHYAAPDLDIFAGDIFDLSAEALGTVDAIYDRAALVALPTEMRARYAQHLMAITACARQFLITFTYDQSLMKGPPFSVPDEAVRALYEADYGFHLLEHGDVPGGLKGVCPATETAWDLRPA